MKKYIMLGISIVLVLFLLLAYYLYKNRNYTGELIGIKGTNIYHTDTCQFVKKAGSTQLIFFENLDKTAESGYRSCKTCNPPSNNENIIVYRQKTKLKEQAAKEKKQKELDDLKQKWEKGEYLTPAERKLIGEGNLLPIYAPKKFSEELKWQKRAKAFSEDVKAGKIKGFDKYDYERIEQGIVPNGKYKDKKDEPVWFEELTRGSTLFY